MTQNNSIPNPGPAAALYAAAAAFEAASASAATAKTDSDRTGAAADPTSTTAPTPGNGNSNNKSAPKSDRGTELLGRPLLLIDEDESDYDALLAAVSAAVKPSDIFEKIWTRDVVHHQWQIQRFRRFTAALINTSKQKALENVLRPLLSYGTCDPFDSKSETLAWKFIMGDDVAIKEVDGLLQTAGLARDVILAEGTAFKIEPIERFDHMAMAAQACRDAALREIERHRTAFGQNLRRAVEMVEDAEYRVIEAPAEQQKAA
jgi:hypothetical protein